MEKNKPLKITLTEAVIIIELVMLASMIISYFFYHLFENRMQEKQELIQTNIETTENVKK